MLNTFNLEKRAFILEETVLAEPQIRAFFEAARRYLVAKSQDREVVLADMLSATPYGSRRKRAS